MMEPAKKEASMWHRGIWAGFIETLAATLIPSGIVARPKNYRNPSWWPI